MEFYEFDDFIQNPDLVNNKTACDSLLSQLLVSTTTITGDVRDKSRILYQILFVANKFSQENDMEAPAAVNITDKGMNLFVNFNYIQKGFGREEYLTVLLHEAYHLLYLHPILLNGNYSEAANIAEDVVINQQPLIDKDVIKRTNGVSLERFTEYVQKAGYDKPIKENYTSPYYLDILNQLNLFQEPDDEPGLVEMMASHGKWKESDNSGDAQETQIKGVIRQLKTGTMTDEDMKQISQIMQSQLPGELGEMFTQLVDGGIAKRLPTLKSVITKLMRDEKDKQRTIRAPKPDNGTKVVKKGFKRRYSGAKKVWFFGDTSASIDFADVEHIIKTLQNQKDKVDAELYLFSDTVYPYSPTEVLTGGTNAQAIFEFLQEQNVDKKTQIVVLTDGYIFEEVDDYGYKNTLWALTENGTDQYIPQEHKTVKFK